MKLLAIPCDEVADQMILLFSFQSFHLSRRVCFLCVCKLNKRHKEKIMNEKGKLNCVRSQT